MKLEINSIQNANHILLVCDNDSFATASAFYTYVLTLHKKVSLQNIDYIETNLAFLPWYNKLRETVATSADYTLQVSSNPKELYDFFIENGININEKMATSLYGATLIHYEAFMGDKCDAMIFEMAAVLINLGAKHTLCKKHICKKNSLSLFRLKALMFKSMLLSKDATCANLYINEDDLKSSGATYKEAYEVMQDALTLVHVTEVILYEDRKILKTIKGNKS